MKKKLGDTCDRDSCLQYLPWLHSNPSPVAQPGPTSLRIRVPLHNQPILYPPNPSPRAFAQSTDTVSSGSEPLCTPCQGQEFVDSATPKATTQDWAVGGAQKFTIRCQRSDATRNVVICAQDCPFCISTTSNKTLCCAKVAKVKDEHICVGIAPVRCAVSSNQEWLQRILLATIPIVRGQSRIRRMARHRQASHGYQATRGWPGSATGPEHH